MNSVEAIAEVCESVGRGEAPRELGFSQSEWEAYHDGILRYRNELVAHHDLAASVAKYPHYDKAIVAANFNVQSVERCC